MKKFIYFTAAILLAGCSSVDDAPSGELGSGDAIKVYADVTSRSRAGYDNSNLDRFGLVIENALSPENSYDVVMARNGQDWTAEDGTTMLWDKARNTVRVAAYAPAEKAMTIGLNSVTVPAEYLSAADFTGADLIVMSRSINPKTDLDEQSRIVINLEHKLARLALNITGVNDITNLRINGLEISGEIDLTVDAPSVVMASSGSTAITPFGTAGSYECLLIPQSSRITVTFDAAGRSWRWDADAETAFEGGKVYTLPLFVDVPKVEVTADYFQVAPWTEAVDTDLNLD